MQMKNDVYNRLADHLATLPGDYISTDSGVELRILRRLFTPEEAEVACKLTLLPESARTVAYRAKKSLAEILPILDSLSQKKLISSWGSGSKARYMAQQFVIGFWESQVDHLSRELVEEFEEYIPAWGDAGIWGRAPQLRTIPVNKSINVENNVMPYEQLEIILDRHTKFGVANCICRQEMEIIGQGCSKPMETCLVFDGGADYFVQVGRGKYLTREEVDLLVKKAEKSALVLQPTNTLNPGNICMCCGCCCGVLRQVKRHPKPASQVSSDFYAVLDVSLCTGCKVCLSRCQMDALTVADDKASLDHDRCIGCGLCVNTCKPHALTLVRKPPREIVSLPKNDVELNIRMGRTHGQLGVLQLVLIFLRSGFDRTMARLVVK